MSYMRATETKRYAMKQGIFLIFLVFLPVAAAGAGCQWPAPYTGSIPPDASGTLSPSTAATAEKSGEGKSAERFIYGYSGQGRPLYAWRIIGSGQEADHTAILCVFAIHGFEDAFFQDGQILVNTADRVVEYFGRHPEELGSCTLIVVPCANPDGLAGGYTCNGPGRCQLSDGYDINMDFDYNFTVKSNSRNRTGPEPLSSPEGRALYGLVMKEAPDIIVDFHGWICSTAGDDQLAEVFAESLDLKHTGPAELIFGGFFSGWAMGVSRAVLVEYPDPFDGQGAWEGNSDQPYECSRDYAPGTIEALGRICRMQ